MCWFKRAFILCGLAFGLMASQAASADSRALDSQRLTFGFMQTVFGMEHDQGWWFSGANRVKKYTVPVRFYVYDRARAQRRRQASRFIKRLPTIIPGLDSALAATPDEANFHLFIVDKKDFMATARKDAGLSSSAAHKAECLVHIWFGRHGISESRAIIVSDQGEHLFRRCLVEEVLQGLGPINDSAALPESVFNDYSRHSSVTAFDRTLMQMLYHPAIKPGMVPQGRGGNIAQSSAGRAVVTLIPGLPLP